MHVARVNLIDWHAIGQQPVCAPRASRQVADAEIARCQAVDRAAITTSRRR
jgi:hypothetical protein